MFDFMYDEQKLSINQIYDFPPFYQHISDQKPGYVISWLLVQLSELNTQGQTKPYYKEILFLKTCDLIQQNIQYLTPDESSKVLSHMALMLTSDLKHVNPPLTEIGLLFEKIYTNRAVLEPQSISLALWAIVSLFKHKKLPEINIKQQIQDLVDTWDLKLTFEIMGEENFGKVSYVGNISMALNCITMLWTSNYLTKSPTQQISRYFDQFYNYRDVASSTDIASYFSSITKLILSKKLDTAGSKRLKELLILFNTKHSSSQQDKITVLSSIAQLILSEKLPTPPKAEIKQLISHFHEQRFSATAQEIADCLWSISMLLSTGTISNINLVEIAGLADALQHHPDSEYKRKGLQALENIRAPEEQQSVFTVSFHAPVNENKEVKEEKADIKSSATIDINSDNIEKIVFDVADHIQTVTGNVFLAGSGAANAALPGKKHKSDYDLRVFDLTADSEKNLIQKIEAIADPKTCKKINGQFPKIQF